MVQGFVRSSSHFGFQVMPSGESRGNPHHCYLQGSGSPGVMHQAFHDLSSAAACISVTCLEFMQRGFGFLLLFFVPSHCGFPPRLAEVCCEMAAALFHSLNLSVGRKSYGEGMMFGCCCCTYYNYTRHSCHSFVLGCICSVITFHNLN